VAVGVLLLTVPILGQGKDNPRTAVFSLLAVYDAGHYDAFDQMLAVQPKGPLAAALRRDGERWVNTGPAQTRDHRRMLVGAVALEITGAGLRDEWDLVSPAIEWACKQVVATAPGSEAEHLWHLGALSLLHDGGGMRPTGQYIEGHLTQHSAKRFPGSSRIQLGVVTDEDRDVYMPVRRSVVEKEIPFEVMRRAIGRADEVAKKYAALMSAPDVAPDVADDARLRLGAFHLRLGTARSAAMEVAESASARSDRVDEAIAALAPLTATTDRYVGYVATFLTGSALRHKGRNTEAAAAFRHALSFVPGAMSASLGLSSILVAAGDVDGAIAAVNGASTAAAPLDPWRMFAFGDARHWPQWRESLRREIRK
jgi:hypothetical protein